MVEYVVTDLKDNEDSTGINKPGPWIDTKDKLEGKIRSLQNVLANEEKHLSSSLPKPFPISCERNRGARQARMPLFLVDLQLWRTS